MPAIILDHQNLAALAQAILSDGHVIRFSAPGYSMFPFIRNGDIIEVNAWGERQPQLMDVVFCVRPSGKVMVHRLLRVVQNGLHNRLFICGDAPQCCGEWIDREQALGWVTFVEHAGQRLRLDSWWMRGMAWLWMTGKPLSGHVLRPGLLLIQGLRRFLVRST